MQPKPVFFFVFANDPSGPGFLASLPDEERELYGLFRLDGRVDLVPHPEGTIEQIFDVFQSRKYRDRITLFHFGGHANSDALFLESATEEPAPAYGKGLTGFVKHQQDLALVFLNGCSSRAHAQRLLDKGVGAVIATSTAIDDKIATRFSQRFYKGIKGGISIQQAFDEAVSAEKAQLGNDPRSAYQRSFLPKPTGEPAPWPWELFVAHDEARSRILVPPDGTLPPLSSLLVPGTGRLPENVADAPSRLLIARHQIVPFTGWEALRADLHRWADGNAEVAVRLIHAPGGIGKTRLAQQWIAERKACGQCAGFLSRALTEQVIGSILEAHAADIVIDYAESRHHLVTLIDAVAQRWQRRADGRIRILLLARNADDWWTVLQTATDGISDLLLDSRPISLPAPIAQSERRAEFERAQQAFSAVLEARPAPHVVWRPVSHPPDLSDRRFRRTLYLHAAALMAGFGETVTASTVLDQVLDHEVRFWLRQAGFKRPSDRASDAAQDFTTDAQSLVAAVTLLGGASDAAELARIAAGIMQVERPHLIRRIARLYPSQGEDGSLAALQPDLLGEKLLVRVLRSNEWRGWLETVTGFAAGRWGTIFTMLGRAEVHDRAVVRAAEAQVLSAELPIRAEAALRCLLELGKQTANAGLGQVLADALSEQSDAALARRFSPLLPSESVMLREVAVWVHETLVLDAKDDAERARHLRALGTAYSAVGRREEALQANRQAADIYRGLAATSPDAFESDLARSLNNLGARLSGLGRREEALQAAQESIDIYRRLATAHPDAFESDVASALNNLGSMLSDLGRREEALQATQEAIAIRRRLATARPDAFEPDLAGALNNLGIRFSQLGRREEALQATQQATDIYRRLATARPDAFEPNLARALTSLGTRFREMGLREEALETTQEATDIRRRLAAARPEAFEPDLAMTLENLGVVLSDLGRREGALRATQEAVHIYQRLATASPKAFGPDLAGALNNLGAMLSGLGRREGALKTTQEAVHIYRRLATARPEAFEPDLASALNNLGADLRGLGRQEEALKATQQAFDIYQRLAAARPDAFEPHLASALNNLGVMLSELGRREEALPATQEAVHIYQRLAAARPDAFEPNLACALNNLGVRFSELGRREEALPATQEAVDIYRRLATARPDAFEPDLAGALNSLGVRFSELGRREEMLQATQETIDIYRCLATACPDAFEPDLAMALNNLGVRFSKVGRRERALQATQEAVNIYRQLATAHSDVFEPRLAGALNNLGAMLSGLGRREEALQAT